MKSCLDYDMKDKVCIVTGANSGIGKEIARNLARMGAHVILACRNEQRAQDAVDNIRQVTCSECVRYMLVDFSSQESIRRFAEAFKAEYQRLDVLVNNAGMFMPLTQGRTLNAEGIEMTFAVNAIGYFLLTELLLDLLKQSAPSRIVNVTSDLAGDLKIDDLNFDQRFYHSLKAYKQSKQANRMLTWELSRRLEGTGVTANALHPGVVATGIVRNSQAGPIKHLVNLYMTAIGDTPEEGADTATWLAANPDLAETSGQFFRNRESQTPKFDDETRCRLLWERCEEMCGLLAEAR